MLCVRLTGELDYAGMPAAAEQLKQVRPEGLVQVNVDLSALTFCDSSGLRMLLVLRRRCADNGVRFVVTGANGMVARTIAVAGLESLLS